MVDRLQMLTALAVAGAVSAVVLAEPLEAIEPRRLARGFLVGVAALMGFRVAAYVAANVFGVQGVRPLSTGPFDSTNVLIGGLYGLAGIHAARGRFAAFLREGDVLLSLRVATGVAFILAGLVNAFVPDGGVGYFTQMGYSGAFRRFIMTAELLGGAALLLPWRWMTVAAVAGLSVDMFGALYTQLRAGSPLDAAAFAMLLRLVPLAVLALGGRWGKVALGALGSIVVAVVGATLLRRAA